jgi:DNA polymerase III delta prime subunit
MLNIHQSIKEKLDYFQKNHKIPNIIFHGPSGCGKRTIVSEFISSIYENDREKIKSLVMYVNCAHGKGIKFIRDELKFFAKTHINSNGGDSFKSIILLNADKLTMDAQSALRRCIELFSHNTRFFIIVEDKYKLLKPILSRFCEIYVSEPEHNGKIINLYKYNLEETFKLTNIQNQRSDWLKKEIQKSIKITMKHEDLQLFVTKLYEKAYNALDIIKLIEDGCFSIVQDKRYELLIAFNKIKKEIRNEKLLLIFVINFTFLDNKLSLENITFI